MSEENVEVVRQPIALKDRPRRGLDERIYLRFPSVVAFVTRAVWRLPPRSRVRRALLLRLVRSAFDAINRGDFQSSFVLHHPDGELITPPRLVGIGFDRLPRHSSSGGSYRPRGTAGGETSGPDTPVSARSNRPTITLVVAVVVLLAVLIADTGKVEQRVIDSGQEISDDVLSELRTRFLGSLSGTPLNLLPQSLQAVIASCPPPRRAAAQALAAGHVHMMFDVVSLALGPIQSGTVRAIGVASKQRVGVLPDVPAALGWVAVAVGGIVVALVLLMLEIPRDLERRVAAMARESGRRGRIATRLATVPGGMSSTSAISAWVRPSYAERTRTARWVSGRAVTPSRTAWARAVRSTRTCGPSEWSIVSANSACGKSRRISSISSR